MKKILFLFLFLPVFMIAQEMDTTSNQIVLTEDVNECVQKIHDNPDAIKYLMSIIMSDRDKMIRLRDELMSDPAMQKMMRDAHNEMMNEDGMHNNMQHQDGMNQQQEQTPQGETETQQQQEDTWQQQQDVTPPGEIETQQQQQDVTPPGETETQQPEEDTWEQQSDTTNPSDQYLEEEGYETEPADTTGMN
jgi:hypothetical protein